MVTSPLQAKRIVVALAGLGAAAFGCNAVLGIDSATFDPTVGVDAASADTGLADTGPVDSGAADTATDAGTPCDQYCTLIMANCTDENLEYTDFGTCEAMCKHFEPGIPGDMGGDSLACRTYHANAAAGDPGFHCRHAGPLGGGTCGSDLCTPFCALDFALCQELTPYDGGQLGCEQQCTAAAFPYITVDAGDIVFAGGVVAAGNNFNCRLYHLEAAYEPNNDMARSTHCPHTAVVSETCF